MNITLYKNFSKRKNSTKRPSGGTLHNCHFKANCSIESPIVLIDGVDLDVNYAFMNGHYYFISDIVVGNNNIYELHLEQDLLATYKDVIGNTRAFIMRSNTLVDHNIPDNNVIAYNNYQYKHMSQDELSIISDNHITEGYVDNYLDHGVYVLHVLAVHMTDRWILLNKTQFNSFINQMPSSVFKSEWDYVIDLYWLPLDREQISSLSQGTMDDGFWMNGHHYFEGQTIYYATDSKEIATGMLTGVLALPFDYGGDWRDYDSRFTDFKLMIFGDIISLNPMYLHDTLYYKLYIDLRIGIACINILNAQHIIIHTHTKNISTKISTGATQMNMFNVGLGMLTAAAGLAAGNPAMSIASSGNVIQNIAHPSPMLVGSTGGDLSNISLYKYIYGIVQRRSSSQLQQETAGLPYCDYNIIGNCAGFVQTSKFSINMDGLGNDRDAINAMMDSGIYYE